MTQPMLTLNDGHKMPQIGAGIWQVPQADTATVVRDALSVGYRLIDGAMAYENEKQLGDALGATDVPRGEIFVTTKLWNSDHGFDATLTGFDASMKRLRLDYLDLYLIHWPVAAAGLYVDSWKAMVRLRKEGRVRSIGVANFNAPHLDRLIGETGETPALNQIELHPTLAQKKMRAADDKLGIVTQSWTPLGRGDFDAPEVKAIAARLGATPAQVVLRWHIQHGLSVIPKSVHKARLEENFGALRIELTMADMAELDALDCGNRVGPDPDTFDMR